FEVVLNNFTHLVEPRDILDQHYPRLQTVDGSEQLDEKVMAGIVHPSLPVRVAERLARYTTRQHIHADARILGPIIPVRDILADNARIGGKVRPIVGIRESRPEIIVERQDGNETGLLKTEREPTRARKEIG